MLNNSFLQTTIKWTKQIEFHWENRGKDLLNSNSVSVQNSIDILCSSETQKITMLHVCKVAYKQSFTQKTVSIPYLIIKRIYQLQEITVNNRRNTICYQNVNTMHFLSKAVCHLLQTWINICDQVSK